MAAEDRRHDDGEDGHTPSLPETEHREREAATDREDDTSGHTPSLPETERREREQERRRD